jgi:hypothetical protein
MRTVARLALATGLALLLGALGTQVHAGANPPPNTNEVAYWCPDGHGAKYDTTGTSFTVPAPPDGQVWTLLVLKAGSDQSVETGENETFPNPVVGQTYSHSSGKTLSHAILCYGPAVTTTPAPTTSAPPTTLATTTTATTLATTTTAPTTTAPTTTAPTTTLATTTTGNQGICCLQAATTTAPTTTAAATTTVAPPVTTAPATTQPAPAPADTTAADQTVAPTPAVASGEPLPVTGSTTVPLLALGLGLLGAGGALTLAGRRS